MARLVTVVPVFAALLAPLNGAPAPKTPPPPPKKLEQLTDIQTSELLKRVLE